VFLLALVIDPTRSGRYPTCRKNLGVELMWWNTNDRREQRRRTHRVGATIAAAACVSAFLTPALALLSTAPASAAGNAVLPTSPGPGTTPDVINNYTPTTLPANDDDSTSTAIPLGFTINFFGQSRNNVWVNNNGNVTFGAALSDFTPSNLTTFGNPILAAFFADVDTRGSGSGVVDYGTGTLNGNRVFVVNYPNVGCFDQVATVKNNFQLILIDRPDFGTGALGDNFQIEYNYNQIQWDTGQASGGNSVCQNATANPTSAFVGYSDGTTTAANAYNLPGSGVAGAFLDTGPNALIANALNSTTMGRYIFFVNGGIPSINPGNNGYRLVANEGGIFAYGLNFHGSLANMHLNAPIVGIANSPGPDGYLMAGGDGGVFAEGGANFYGSLGGQVLPSPIAAIASTRAGDGYWLAAQNGKVYHFGSAPDLPALMLPAAAHVTGMASTPDGKGLWLTDQLGDVYAEGDAIYMGGANTVHPNAPIVGIASLEGAQGYVQVGADGGVYSYGVGFFGSVPGTLAASGHHLNAPIVGIALTHSGKGYWEVGGDGGVFTYGDAPFLGSMGGIHLNGPIVGIQHLGTAVG
jgi:hypothetical protein